MANKGDRFREIRGSLEASLPPPKPLRKAPEFNPDIQQYPQMPLPGGQGGLIALAGLAAGLSGSQDPINMIMGNIQRQREQAMQLAMENVSLNNQVAMERAGRAYDDEVHRRDVDAERLYQRGRDIWKGAWETIRAEDNELFQLERDAGNSAAAMDRLVYERTTNDIDAGRRAAERNRELLFKLRADFEHNGYKVFSDASAEFTDQYLNGISAAADARQPLSQYFKKHPFKIHGMVENPETEELERQVLWTGSDPNEAISEFKKMGAEIKEVDYLRSAFERGIESIAELHAAHEKNWEVVAKVKINREARISGEAGRPEAMAQAKAAVTPGATPLQIRKWKTQATVARKKMNRITDVLNQALTAKTEIEEYIEDPVFVKSEFERKRDTGEGRDGGMPPWEYGPAWKKLNSTGRLVYFKSGPLKYAIKGSPGPETLAKVETLIQSLRSELDVLNAEWGQ